MTPAITRIIRQVADALELNPADIVSKYKHKNLARARLLCYLLARDLTKFSYPEIGRAFRRDHSTVVAGCRVAARAVKADEELRAIYDSIAHAESIDHTLELARELQRINTRITLLKRRAAQIAEVLRMNEREGIAAE